MSRTSYVTHELCHARVMSRMSYVTFELCHLRVVSHMSYVTRARFSFVGALGTASSGGPYLVKLIVNIIDEEQKLYCFKQQLDEIF